MVCELALGDSHTQLSSVTLNDYSSLPLLEQVFTGDPPGFCGLFDHKTVILLMIPTIVILSMI